VLAATLEKEQATSSSTARGKRDAKEAIELSTTDQEFPEAGSFTTPDGVAPHYEKIGNEVTQGGAGNMAAI